MLNIYDIEVNFNKKLFDFFDWNETDILDLIRKTPLVKVADKTYNLFLKGNIIVDKELLQLIKDKTEVYNEKKYEKIEYACSITNGYDAICIMFDSKGNISRRSRLNIEDEIEIIELSSSLKTTTIGYKEVKKYYKYNFLLRSESKIIKEILFNLNKYKDDSIKIEYLYYEWFNKKSTTNNCYEDLLIDIKKTFSNKHKEFLNVIKLFVV
ncbi:MAG: hypothetical protein RR940_02795 [Bacilli bacterium]